MDAQSPDRLALLEAHKSLSRRLAFTPQNTSPSLDETSWHRSFTSAAKVAEITSWIQDASPSSISSLLPLTPPENPGEKAERQEDKGAMGAPQQNGFLHSLSQQSLGAMTPLNNVSPPTPDLTPPRRIRDQKATLTPPLFSRHPSSRADSFATARERLSPSNDHESDALKTPSPEATQARNVSGTTATNSVGLGIGMSPGGASRTAVDATAAGLFDQASPWDGAEPPLLDDAYIEYIEAEGVADDPLVATVPLAVKQLGMDGTLFESPAYVPNTFWGKESKSKYDRLHPPAVVNTPVKGPPEARKPMLMKMKQESTEVSPISPVSVQRSIDVPDPLAIRAHLDSKRFSTISATSEMVAAIIIDTPRQRHQKLRHSNKNPSLRGGHPSHGESNRSSFISSVESKPRLETLLGNAPERDGKTQESFKSDRGISMGGSDHVMRRWSQMQQNDIPGRRQSYLDDPLQRSSTAAVDDTPGRLLSSAMTPLHMHPVQAFNRPLPAPVDPNALHDLKRTKNRTFSDASRRAVPSQRQIGLPALEAIGLRSVSSPARHTAAHRRTASSSSKPQAHLIPPTAPIQPLQITSPNMRSVSEPQSSPRLPIWAHRSSDAFDQRPQPLSSIGSPRPRADTTSPFASRSFHLKTPFSGVSMQSSTSGIYEVHEATAINIYPHTNRSLLMVQQDPVGEDGEGTAAAAASDNLRLVTAQPPGITTVPVVNIGKSGRLLDSPLTDHRTVPEPPAVNLIPPTPMGASPISALDSKHTFSRSNIGPTGRGPIAIVRRALSNRRYSGTALTLPSLRLGSSTKNSPITGFTKADAILGRRTKSTERGRTNTSTSAEENLSPFWRPRGFWDDLSDDEDDEMDDDEDAVGDLDHGNDPETTFEDQRMRSLRRRQRARSMGEAEAVRRKSEDEDERNGDYFTVRNTLGLPQKRGAIPGPAALARRLGSLRRRRDGVKVSPASARPGGTRPNGRLGVLKRMSGDGTGLGGGSGSSSRNASAVRAGQGKWRRRVTRFDLMRGMKGKSGARNIGEGTPRRQGSRGSVGVVNNVAKRTGLRQMVRDRKASHDEKREEKWRRDLRRRIGPPVLQDQSGNTGARINGSGDEMI